MSSMRPDLDAIRTSAGFGASGVLIVGCGRAVRVRISRLSAFAMRKAIFVFIATLAGGIVVADFADAQGC
jgi:hypothetical protein